MTSPEPQPEMGGRSSTCEAMIMKVRLVLRGPKGSRNPLHAHVGEFLLWLTPLVLALMGHLFGSMKVNMSGHGPGFHIAFMNDRTRWAQDVCRFMMGHAYLFACYGGLLLAVCFALKRARVPWYFRALALVMLAVPGLWYFLFSFYLGGSMISI